MKPETIWVCGQLKGEYRRSGSIWEFQGVFSDEDKAIDACRDENYFIFPAILNKKLPHKSIVPKEAWYPVSPKKIK